MEIKRFCAAEIQALLPLVWEVFLTYEAAGYPERGKQAFWSAIHDPEYLSSLCAYGAYDGGEAVGILVTREKGSHTGDRRYPVCADAVHAGSRRNVT